MVSWISFFSLISMSNVSRYCQCAGIIATRIWCRRLKWRPRMEICSPAFATTLDNTKCWVPCFANACSSDIIVRWVAAVVDPGQCQSGNSILSCRAMLKGKTIHQTKYLPLPNDICSLKFDVSGFLRGVGVGVIDSLWWSEPRHFCDSAQRLFGDIPQ